mmetsp:Transcript_48169/g.151127  ORF Transcript_48169/g.151127 Transcript_48169/m.151127 type:complete len:81 (-) Transcript_48169:1316-1558(-)
MVQPRSGPSLKRRNDKHELKNPANSPTNEFFEEQGSMQPWLNSPSAISLTSSSLSSPAAATPGMEEHQASREKEKNVALF